MTCHACGAPVTVREGQHCARCVLTAAAGEEPVLFTRGAEEAPPCELLSLIGETSRATTFLAEQNWPVRRLVAFKLFKNDLSCAWMRTGEPSVLPRHANIGHVIECGRMSGRPYVMTKYFAGGHITGCYDRHRLGLRDRLEALVTISAALAFAHRLGVVHGHLIPSNVLCEPRAPFVARIVDFHHQRRTPDDKTALEVMHRADLDAMIELATALLGGPTRRAASDNAAVDAVAALRISARSAEDLRDAFEQLHARTGTT